MKRALIAAIAAAFTTPLFAGITVNSCLTDSMVIQRNSRLIISGKAFGRVCVEPSWDADSPHCVLADSDSTFSIAIPTPDAGGPFTISIRDDKGNAKTLKDIYSGEVWLCSGQSNMEMPLAGWGKVNNYEAEIAGAANYPLIRLLQINRHISAAPQNEAVINMGGWRKAAPGTVDDFSSVAYFYARELHEKLGGIPVGVIDCTWGGTPVESWTPIEGCKAIGDLHCDAVLADAADNGRVYADYLSSLNDWREYVRANDNFDFAHKQKNLKKVVLPGRWEESALPGFDGIVWFQREISLPKEMQGKDLTLSLGKIDDWDITYVNGRKVGETNVYNDNRLYKVPASLANDKLLISVRVTDNGEGGGFWGQADEMFVSDGLFRVPLNGDWDYNVVIDYATTPMPRAPYDQYSPSVLYNAMVHPLRDLDIAGTIWYQGCSNVGRAEQYSRLFPRMISDWRKAFGKLDMPFYFVQLAGYLKPELVQPDSEWAALRKAQTAALALPNTGMVTAIDIGQADDIHPKNKQEVARRLALKALNDHYGISVSANAPSPVSVDYNGEKALITFNDEIVNIRDYPKGFVVLTADGEWQRPRVELVGNTISLSSDDAILEIKYDWADFPDGNIYGINGLPVMPFEHKKAVGKEVDHAFPRESIPEPVYSQNQDFVDLYWAAWRLAWDRVKYQERVPQSPYMDENLWDDTIWIWDTEFMVLFCRYAPDKYPGIESLNNFYECILNKQPTFLRIHHPDNPPFYSWVEWEYYKVTGNKERLKSVLVDNKFLQRHYRWFDSIDRNTTLHFSHEPIKLEKDGLGYRWGDIQSGMDNTPRTWDAISADSMLWVDALAQQALSALYISRIAKELGEKEVEKEYSSLYNENKSLLNKYYWDNADGFYYDLNPTDTSFIKVRTPAVYWAMLAEAPTKEQAKRLAQYATDPMEFGGKYPWPTVTRRHRGYFDETGDYWRGAVWLPTAYMSTKALETYGYYDIAADNARKLLTQMSETYKNFSPATIWECYSPSENKPSVRIYDDHRELVRPDFCGWSALGPISLFIENVLGFYNIDAAKGLVEWRKEGPGEQGIKKLRFGEITTDILADDNVLSVVSNKPYKLKVNGKTYKIKTGTNTFKL